MRSRYPSRKATKRSQELTLPKLSLVSSLLILGMTGADITQAEDQSPPAVDVSKQQTVSNEQSPTTPASKQQKAPDSKKDSKSSDTPVVLEDMVVVTATRSELSASLAPANPTVINEQNTQNRLTQRIGDALLEVPGVYLRGSAYGTQWPGTGTGGAAIHGITDQRRSLFMVDGLPVNNGASNSVDWNTLNTDDARQIEFVPGPFSALYGSSAMGGVINVISQEPTKREGSLTAGGGGGAVDQWGVKGKYRDRFANGLGVSLTYTHMDSSGYNTSDPVIATGSAAANSSALPVYGAIPTATDANGKPALGYLLGYKGARPWEQDNASLRLYYDLTDHTKIDAGMAWTRSTTNLTAPDSFLINATNGAPFPSVAGSKSINVNGLATSLAPNTFLQLLPNIEDTRRYFSHLRHDFGSDIKLSADFQYMENTSDYQYANNTLDTLTTGPGQLSSQPNHRIDGNLALRFPLLWKDRNFMTTGFGFNQNVLDASQKANLNDWTNASSISKITNLGSGQSTILSGYFQDELYIRKNLIAYAGGRYDDWSTNGSYMQTSPAYNATYKQRGQGQFNPKFGLTWLPANGYKLFASSGWAFRPPTMLDLYSTSVANSIVYNGVATPVIRQASPGLKPETMFSFEFGGEIKPIEGTTLAASYFHHYLNNLIYNQTLSPVLQQVNNAGAAEVQGVEIKFKQQLYWDWLNYTGTYTFNNSRITANTADPLSVGKQITQTPKTMFTSGLDVNYANWSGGIIGRYVSKAYSNADNFDTLNGVYGTYDPYFIVDTRVKYQATKHIGVTFSLNNLLDRNYFSYYQMAGRTFYGDVTYSF